MESSKIMMFPEMGNSGIDPNLLLAMNNNGGFGGNNWIWILFLWLIWGNNGWGNNGLVVTMVLAIWLTRLVTVKVVTYCFRLLMVVLMPLGSLLLLPILV